MRIESFGNAKKIMFEQVPGFGCTFLPLPVVWHHTESSRLLTCPSGNLGEASYSEETGLRCSNKRTSNSQ